LCVTCTDNDSVNQGIIKSLTACFDFEIKGFNNPPVFSGSFSDAELPYDETMTYNLPSYSDIDPLDILIVDCKMADGSALPGWIVESSSSTGAIQLDIAPSISEMGNSYYIKLTVTDSNSERGEG